MVDGYQVRGGLVGVFGHVRIVPRARRWWRRQPGRVRFAVVLIAASAIGWPISAVTFARGEPFTILGLSWLAPLLTGVDILFTAQVHAQNDDNDGD